MAWLRCPHCATLLPNTPAADGEMCGCPACGGVFARKADAKKGRETLYPPEPKNVPDDLTVPSTLYRQGVLLLSATLLLFVALYLGLLVGSGCLIFWSLRWLGFWGVPWAFFFLLIFLYLLKGFFKSERQGKSLQVEITEEEQPQLFAFIHRLCDEVGAAAPHRVFLTPDVNAAAETSASLFGLLRPTPKNLILGLGLVNVLTLSEFKAVLAHEFGHFAQSSMKLGVCVYAVNRVLLEVVAGRDWLDYLLLRLRCQPHVVGLVGTLCWGVVTGLRQAMIGLFYAINFLDRSLSRQMEFHADLVAVSVTGSEAIVRALARMDFANEALGAAADDLKMTAVHGRYSQDLFAHQRDAMERLREKRKDPRLGEPPPLTADPLLAPEVFDPEDGPPQMWADHPPNYDREQNAKRHYVPCRLDERPAWLLFEDTEEACERVTWRFYRMILKIPRDAILEEPDAIRDFLHQEREAATYDPRYHGMYDDRFVVPGELNDMIAADNLHPPAPAALRRQYAALYGETLAQRAAVYQRHLEERKQLLECHHKNQEKDEDKQKPLKLRGRTYHPSRIEEVLELLDKQLQKDRSLLAEEDCAVFLVHYRMSRQLKGTATQELRQRYAFHLTLQRLLANMMEAQERLGFALGRFAEQNGKVVSGQVFSELSREFRWVRDTFRRAMEEADALRLPPLPNVEAGASLGPLLWDRPLVGRLGETGSLSGKKIQKLHEQLAEVIVRARYVHFKSLGGVLALQEKIARQWLQQIGEG
jgi:Zn-dependent protease with chaperone function/Zn-finger nucleic acid-binding protein